MIGPKKITTLEIGYGANTRFDDNYRARFQQHNSLCQILEKERHDEYLHPIILGMQGFVLNCFKAAITAVGVQGQLCAEVIVIGSCSADAQQSS